MDKSNSLKFCIIFLTVCAATVGPVYMLSGRIAMGTLLIALVAILDAVYYFVRKKNRHTELSYIVVLSAVVIIAVTQIVSGDISFTVQMLMVTVSLSVLFFDLRLIKLTTVLALALFTVQYAVLSIKNHELVLSILRYVESNTAIIMTGVLVHNGARYGLRYLQEAGDKQEQTDEVLKELDQKKQQTEEMLGRRRDVLQQIGAVANELNTAADNLSYQAENLAVGSGFQAEAIIRLSDSVDSVSKLIRDTDGQAQNVRDSLKVMEQEIIEGNTSMENMVNAVNDISANMQDIEKIIKSINDIAFQTNLLALNASVEAARAGAAGKGFTVVANEVRNLAQRSSDAVKETIRVLDNCQNAVNRGNKVAGDTAAMLNAIKSHAGDVTRIAFKISEMTAQQMTGLDKVNTEVNAVTDEIQKTADVANESSASVKELTEQAQMLQALSKH